MRHATSLASKAYAFGRPGDWACNYLGLWDSAARQPERIFGFIPIFWKMRRLAGSPGLATLTKTAREVSSNGTQDFLVTTNHFTSPSSLTTLNSKVNSLPRTMLFK